MTRGQLKSLVKECLLELLRDGLGDTQQVLAPPMPQRQAVAGMQESRAPQQKKFDPRLDTPIGKPKPAVPMQAIKQVAAGNSVMESIFADTAATTLVEQAQSGDRGGATTSMPALSQTEHFNGNPEDVFGEASAHWASLAFMELPKKR